MPPRKASLKIVCISDTHGAEIPIPNGDLLLHAGDLTEKGTFDQIQAALKWLSKQPHDHKVVIAGNHDGLLDAEFVKNYPKQYPGETRGETDLDWGSLIYLKDSSVKLRFRNGRSLTVFGSPWTCRAKGFGAALDEDIWKRKIPLGTDILLTHGPPHGHLDSTKLGNRGSKSLMRELKRVRPKLVVCGHIHEGYGQEILTFGEQEPIKDETVTPGTLGSLFGMFFSSTNDPVRKKPVKTTKLVNAAVPKPSAKENREGQKRNEPIIVQI